MTIRELYDQNAWSANTAKDLARRLLGQSLDYSRMAGKNLQASIDRRSQEAAAALADKLGNTAVAGGTPGGIADYFKTFGFDAQANLQNQLNAQNLGALQQAAGTEMAANESMLNRNLGIYQGLEVPWQEKNRQATFGDIAGGVLNTAAQFAPLAILSSKDKKKEIKKLTPEEALQSVVEKSKKLKKFKYKADPDGKQGKEHSGFIAEDNPDIADKSKTGITPTGISDMVANLTGAVAALQKKVKK